MQPRVGLSALFGWREVGGLFGGEEHSRGMWLGWGRAVVVVAVERLTRAVRERFAREFHRVDFVFR